MSDMPAMTSNAPFVSIQPSSIMVSMDMDGGNVKIDWTEVEKQAQGNDSYLRPLAKALIAVRDKTYVALDHQ